MRHILKKNLMIVALFVVAALLISSCANEFGTKITDDRKIKVVASIYPLYEFAKEVGGEKAEVYLLLPAGAEPHSWEPKPSDIARVAESDMFIYAGAGLESWLEPVKKAAGKDIKVIDSSSIVALITSEDHKEEDDLHEAEHGNEEHHEHADDEEYETVHVENEEDPHIHESPYDPHFWLDITNDMKLIESIAEEYSLVQPENREYFMLNAKRYNELLSSLDKKYIVAFEDCKHNTFITGGHSAFGYLAERYGLEQIAVSGISPDAEPSPKKIKEIVDVAKEKEIKYIFFETLVNPKVSEVISNEVDAKTLVLNDGASLTKEEIDSGKGFIWVMEKNLESLKTGLECK